MKIKIKESRKHDFRFEVANLITEARYHYDLTQAQLAKKMGTQQPSIARIESGSTLPSLSFLERLADSIGTYLIAPRFGFMAQENSFAREVSKQSINVNLGSGLVPGYFKVGIIGSSLTMVPTTSHQE